MCEWSVDLLGGFIDCLLVGVINVVVIIVNVIVVILSDQFNIMY